MTEQPHHFGPATRLEEYSGLHVDRYFFVTPVSQWSLTSFYNTCSDHRTFMDGLDKISQWKAVDRAIRSYSYAWFSFLDGELGQLRIEAIRKGVTADLTSEIVVTEERQLAQQKLRSRLGRELVMNKEPHELPPESPRSFLGKRPRKDEHKERSSNKKTTHINNPFMVEVSAFRSVRPTTIHWTLGFDAIFSLYSSNT
ncbi:hypothetical protein B0O80DRAFT_154805 [Mortierella sp. GBAus27b]|nr:hypothetical protein B0O80DRAFT_154805 [Mortierella sp. GBAus27b]